MSHELWDDLWGDSKEEIAPKSSFNAMKLTKYFDNELIGTNWYKGFGLTNYRAMAGALARWKNRADSDTVKAMIDRYMTDSTMRGPNPGWKDFISQAERIATAVSKPVVASAKTYWQLETEKWEREHEDS